MGGATAEAPSVDRRDWAGGLPADVLAKVAEAVVAQTEAGWAAQLREWGWNEEKIQEMMAERKRAGNCCLFVFARVCKEWRKAQLKVGGPLRTRWGSDVIRPGSVALAKWALAEGCPRYNVFNGTTMAYEAAVHGHTELVKWLCGEGGFAMDEMVMCSAVKNGDLELVKWMRAEGCELNKWTSYSAVLTGHVEVLRWLRENGCEWAAETRDKAAELGYTDNFGNVVELLWWDDDEDEEEDEDEDEDEDEEEEDEEDEEELQPSLGEL